MEQGSYMLLESGMKVQGADGHSLGTITEVVADANADIFRGFVLSPGLLGTEVFVPGEHVVSVVDDIATVDLDQESAASLRPASEMSTRTEA